MNSLLSLPNVFATTIFTTSNNRNIRDRTGSRNDRIFIMGNFTGTLRIKNITLTTDTDRKSVV